VQNETLRLPLYTGIDDTVMVAEQGGQRASYKLARDYSIDVSVTIEPVGAVTTRIIDMNLPEQLE
jgi:hypothetical protein